MRLQFSAQGLGACNGQFLPINQNQALFSLLGTMYGGNGQTTFALPDLRGRAAIHHGQGFVQGQAGGQEVHTLTMSEMPAHNHFMSGINAGRHRADSDGNILGAGSRQTYHGADSILRPWLRLRSSTVGGSQAHENRQPYLVLNFVIALQGIFPSRN